MQNYLIKNVQVVNEGRIISADVLIKNGRIEKIGELVTQADSNITELNGEGKYLLPGAIDDQVHFREPGLTHKATIYSEAKAAVAGGVTSFMEMPNTIPNALTQELLEDKYAIAAKTDEYNLHSLYRNNIEYLSAEHRDSIRSKNTLGRFYRTPANLYEVHVKDFDLIINPVIQFQYMKESDDDASLFLNSRGVAIRGRIANKIGWR